MSSQSLINEIKNYYDTEQAEEELSDMLQTNGLINKKQYVLDFIKTITGKSGDSYTIRETGKFLSDIVNELKIHNIRE